MPWTSTSVWLRLWTYGNLRFPHTLWISCLIQELKRVPHHSGFILMRSRFLLRRIIVCPFLAKSLIWFLHRRAILKSNRSTSKRQKRTAIGWGFISTNSFVIMLIRVLWKFKVTTRMVRNSSTTRKNIVSSARMSRSGLIITFAQLLKRSTTQIGPPLVTISRMNLALSSGLLSWELLRTSELRVTILVRTTLIKMLSMRWWGKSAMRSLDQSSRSLSKRNTWEKSFASAWAKSTTSAPTSAV